MDNIFCLSMDSPTCVVCNHSPRLGVNVGGKCLMSSLAGHCITMHGRGSGGTYTQWFGPVGGPLPSSSSSSSKNIINHKFVWKIHANVSTAAGNCGRRRWLRLIVPGGVVTVCSHEAIVPCCSCVHLPGRDIKRWQRGDTDDIYFMSCRLLRLGLYMDVSKWHVVWHYVVTLPARNMAVENVKGKSKGKGKGSV